MCIRTMTFSAPCHCWFSGLWPLSGTYTLDSPSLRSSNYVTCLPMSPACKWQLVGTLGLLYHMGYTYDRSSYVLIGYMHIIYIHVSMYNTHTHNLLILCLESPNTSFNASPAIICWPLVLLFHELTDLRYNPYMSFKPTTFGGRSSHSKCQLTHLAQSYAESVEYLEC